MSSLEIPNTTRSDSEIHRQSAGWRILCIGPDREVLTQLSAVTAHCLPGTSSSELHYYPTADELPHCIGKPLPNIVFLDFISDGERALNLVPEILKIDKGIGVIALLAASEPQLILRCLRQGATEFLLQPFTAEQLDASLAKLIRTLPKEKLAPKQLAKIVTVIPAKGACGASTVASNLAFCAKRGGSSRVLLADLDPLTGTISFLLKLKSSYSFLDVLHHADTLDSDMWKTMVTQRAGVDVLLSPEAMFEGAGELRDPRPVIDYSRANYDMVVLDAPGPYGEWNLTQAKLCDELILVTTNELPALQAAQRALSYFEANRVGRWKIKVVVNRYDKDVGLSRDVIGTALHTDVFHVVPSDYEAIQKSLIEGKTISPSSTLGRSFTQLNDRLSGKKKESKPTTSSFGGLLSLFSRTSS